MKRVIKQFFYLFSFTLFLFSCADKSSFSYKTSDSDKYFGIQITNYLPTGAMYADSAGILYQYRSFIIEIFNDTLIPVNLQIEFPNKYSEIGKNKYKVFLLPDSMTKERQYDSVATKGLVSKAFELFLDRGLYKSALKKVIQPGEKYKLRLGFLFDANAGLTRAELFSKGHRQNLFIPGKEIKISNTNKNAIELILGVALDPGPAGSYSVLNCGQLSFFN